MFEDAHLRILLVDVGGALGAALVQALRRVGAEVTCLGQAPEAVEGVRLLPGWRARPETWQALRGAFDAVVDGGARGLDGPAHPARELRHRVGLVVQLGTWRVYAGSLDAPTCGAAPGVPAPDRLPVPCPEGAPLRDGEALGAEDGLWNARAQGGYPATVLRLAPLYGPGVRLAREWHVLGRLRAGRRQLGLPDGGGQLLHRLYLDNAVHAVLCALNHPREADGHTFNVGDGRIATLAELAASLAVAVERPLEGVPLPRAVLDTHSPFAVPAPVVLDLHRARARLAYVPPVDLLTALERTARWLWALGPDDLLPTLEPYWQRYACGHDYLAEEAALARWTGGGR